MKKFFLILLVPLFIGASCTKNNDVNPIPDPDPNPTEYKAIITVTFNVPAAVTLVLGNDMWILRSDKEQITNRIDVLLPTTTIVLTGDTVKNNLGKKVYLYFEGSRVIERLPNGYHIRKEFTLGVNNTLVFDVPADKTNIEILDP
ncbi:hypothetical protein K9M09_02920 [Patescibacteria group bacterium]|nr:hypothetical protein [Patescibacteria group bacterium]